MPDIAKCFYIIAFNPHNPIIIILLLLSYHIIILYREVYWRFENLPEVIHVP